MRRRWRPACATPSSNSARWPSKQIGSSKWGTIHLSAADGAGNMAALTLTHGGGFGARVTVEGLGLILGHGMSRFDPRPGRANSPGPGKRPLHNMCPTIVVRDGEPVLAVGARGGRRIPNCVLNILLNYCGRKRSVSNPWPHRACTLKGACSCGWTMVGMNRTWRSSQILATK